MAHDLNEENGRYSIAYAGSRENVWHRHGQEQMQGKSLAEWLQAANLDFHVGQAEARAVVFPGTENARTVDAPGYFNYNEKTGAIYAHVSDRYKVFQPADMADFFQQFISVDDRWSFDVMGKLGDGSTIWMLAKYTAPIEVAGDKHQAHLLASTTFDTTGATLVKPTLTRVVCRNTFNASLADKRAMVKVRHNTRFDKDRVAKQIADMARGIDIYKQMGDAMALDLMAAEEVSTFFKDMLEIPHDVTEKDIGTDKFSSKKANAYMALRQDYQISVREGAPAKSSWAALQAVTRFVDHDRNTRKGAGMATEDEARFASANFGSGDAMKGKAMGLLMPRIKDKVLIPA